VVRVVESLVFCVVFCQPCLSFCLNDLKSDFLSIVPFGIFSEWLCQIIEDTIIFTAKNV
jgi:hypothetical protein